MTLTCSAPTYIDVGETTGYEWKFNGREIKDSDRLSITISGMKSSLTINNVILADIGNFKLSKFLGHNIFYFFVLL